MLLAVVLVLSLWKMGIAQTGGAVLEFEKTDWDFGRIHDGDIVEHVFAFRNSGSDTLKISDVRPSCGCTAALLSSSELLPGEKGEIKSTFNSHNKRDKVTKTIVVTSNDRKHPRIQLQLTAFILPPVKAHETMSNQGSYFEGQCANCHVERGVGKLGAELFAADCAMCHGEYGFGGVTTAINRGDFLKNVSDDKLQEVISKGSPKNPMMRGFAQTNGGPLDAAQIQSLVQFIRSWQEAYQ